MKIPKYKNYAVIKEQLKQRLSQSKQEAEIRIKQARDYIEPKAKEYSEKAASWTEEKFKDAKQSYSAAKQKMQPKVDEFVSKVEYTFSPPKCEILAKDVANLKKEVLQKSAFIGLLKARNPEQTYLIHNYEKELLKLERKTQIAIDKYNKFVAKQEALQRAFENLNGI